MLRHLHIESFALVEDLRLDFAAGFTAVSGETGAGKSVLLDALQSLLGARASAESVRAGGDRALVEAEFDIEGRASIARWLVDAGLDDDGALLLRREVNAAGRSRADGFRVHACLDLDLWPMPRERPPRAPMHGTAEQILDTIGRYAEIGVTDIVLSAMSPEALAGGRSRLVEQLERFATEVISSMAAPWSLKRRSIP